MGAKALALAIALSNSRIVLTASSSAVHSVQAALDRFCPVWVMESAYMNPHRLTWGFRDRAPFRPRS